MPQLNPEFFISQLFWLVITFTFLFIFLWRISLPRISSVLEKREYKINEDIALAKKLSRTGISLSLEVSSTAVATLISAHLAAAIENIAHVEYHSLHQVFFDRLGNVGPENPPDNCSLPIRPGLGIDLQGSDVILMAEIGN